METQLDNQNRTERSKPGRGVTVPQWSSRRRANEHEGKDQDFWTVYLIGAYQGPLLTDHDHVVSTQLNAMLGYAKSITRMGTPDIAAAMVYRETIRDKAAAAPVSETTLLRATSLHEAGHLFGLNHSSGIMDPSAIFAADTTAKTNALVFSGADLLTIVVSPYPGWTVVQAPVSSSTPFVQQESDTTEMMPSADSVALHGRFLWETGTVPDADQWAWPDSCGYDLGGVLADKDDDSTSPEMARAISDLAYELASAEDERLEGAQPRQQNDIDGWFDTWQDERLSDTTDGYEEGIAAIPAHRIRGRIR